MSASEIAAAVSEPGLRERKRRATRRAILLAAIQVVREKGLEGTTVDEIARIADVSPRTFFNYFSSKEEAIVGDGPELPDDEFVEAFVGDRGPILPGIAKMFSSVVGPTLQDQEIILLRRDIMKQYPELGGRRWASLHRFEYNVSEVVSRRLVAENPALAADPRALASKARLVAFVAIAAMRHAWLDWIAETGEKRDLLEHLDDSFGMLPGVLTESGSH